MNWRRRLIEIAGLTKNWDSYAAQPIPKETLRKAFRFLLISESLRLPDRVSPCGHGSIIITYKNGTKLVYIEIYDYLDEFITLFVDRKNDEIEMSRSDRLFANHYNIHKTINEVNQFLS